MLSLPDSCKYILSKEIIHPFKESGDDYFQVSSTYKSPWDADNTNIMRALYCLLFPKIKNRDTCLRESGIIFYEAKRRERIGETLNSYNTMLGPKKLGLLHATDDFMLKLKDFHHSYHKPGNFIPFPGSLNITKGYDNTGWNYLGDFFDVKLKIIKSQWDKIHSGDSYVPLLNLNKDFFCNFKTFEDYCSYFYLEKYLNANKEIKYLCKHNGYNKTPYPFTMNDCIEYIKNALDIINYRSNKMADSLATILTQWRKNH
jgi:hypothetical protein